MKCKLVLFPLILLCAPLTAARPILVARSDNSIVRKVIVPVGDIDRNAPDARQRIEARIRRAAAQVCRVPPADTGLGWDIHGCYVSSVADAIAAAGLRSDRR